MVKKIGEISKSLDFPFFLREDSIDRMTDCFKTLFSKSIVEIINTYSVANLNLAFRSLIRIRFYGLAN